MDRSWVVVKLSVEPQSSLARTSKAAKLLVIFINVQRRWAFANRPGDSSSRSRP